MFNFFCLSFVLLFHVTISKLHQHFSYFYHLHVHRHFSFFHLNTVLTAASVLPLSTLDVFRYSFGCRSPNTQPLQIGAYNGRKQAQNSYTAFIRFCPFWHSQLNYSTALWWVLLFSVLDLQLIQQLHSVLTLQPLSTLPLNCHFNFFQHCTYFISAVNRNQHILVKVAFIAILQYICRYIYLYI